mmetsp:Transcript_34046/g.71705  ORF Transcript_34046/g.71705 Transcript_34046/m.71705 type:complete len:284 (-) Transcript_34046:222-1073(-)
MDRQIKPPKLPIEASLVSLLFAVRFGRAFQLLPGTSSQPPMATDCFCGFDVTLCCCCRRGTTRVVRDRSPTTPSHPPNAALSFAPARGCSMGSGSLSSFSSFSSPSPQCSDQAVLRLSPSLKSAKLNEGSRCNDTVKLLPLLLLLLSSLSVIQNPSWPSSSRRSSNSNDVEMAISLSASRSSFQALLGSDFGSRSRSRLGKCLLLSTNDAPMSKKTALAFSSCFFFFFSRLPFFPNSSTSMPFLSLELFGGGGDTLGRSPRGVNVTFGRLESAEDGPTVTFGK